MRVRTLTASGIVTGLVLVSMGLGVAMPAQALVPAPPNPVSLSSELAAAGSSGAELAGTAGVAAFAPVAPLGVAVGGFSFGFQMVGAVLAPFGIDESADVCQLVQQTGTGDLDLMTSVLTGANCETYKNTIPPAQQNVDAPGSASSAQVCVAGSGCIQVSGTFAFEGGTATCFLIADTSQFHQTGFAVDYGGGLWASLSSQTGSVGTSCGAQPAAPAEYYGIFPMLHGFTGDVVQGVAALDHSGEAAVTVTKSNPTRHWECTVKGSDGNTYTGTSADFTEVDASLAGWACPTLPGGVVPTQTEVDLVTPSLGTSTPEWTGNTTGAYQTAAAAYPECATGTCRLMVLTATREDCATAGTCADWFADPNKTSDYICEYGTHDVALSECNVMAHFYDPQAVAAGKAYSDPSTGAETGTQTSGNLDESQMNAPASDPNADGSNKACFPTGWGVMNPLNWVVQPLQCALRWAFVPRASVIAADVDSVEGQWKTKMPGQIAAIIGGISFQAPTGCSGIAVPVGWLTGKSGQTMQIMAACSGDLLAPIATWAKIVGDVMFTVYGALAVSRHIARVVGFGGVGQDGGSS